MMAKFQIRNGQGSLTIPHTIWKRKGWEQGIELDIIENIEGDIIIREVSKK